MMKKSIKLLYDAEVLELKFKEIEHHLHLMFHVSFSNGYENIFYTDPENGQWIEQDMGHTGLAGAIGLKLSALSDAHKRNRCTSLRWLRESLEGRIVSFGYHHYRVAGCSVFEIFATNKRFLFTLIKVDAEHWQVIKMAGSGEWTPDRDIMYDVPSVLEKYVRGSHDNDLT